MWKKEGLVFNVEREFEWSQSHAQVPVIDVLDNKLRIYYATRNKEGKSGISFIETEKDNPKKILYIHTKTLLALGNLGSFDDSGTMPSSIVTVGDRKFLYYIGWTTRGTVPYQNAIGLAVSEDGGISFKKISEGPIITVNHKEPYFSGTSFVMLESGKFKMWYLSCAKWIVVENKPEPIYNIKYAESDDGINWKQTGKVAIPLEDDEGGIVSASVIKEQGCYRMWYGKRKKTDYRENSENSYRIGYAESKDGVLWKRKDSEAGITISRDGWDSEMISYPYIVKVSNRLLMFYNGNGFGKSGFGYATS